jgi:hypothetical protein
MAENQNLREARSYQFAAEFELRRAQERLAGLTSLGRLERETDTLRRETQQLQDAQREYQQLQNQPGAPQLLLNDLRRRIDVLEGIVIVAQQRTTSERNALTQAQNDVRNASFQVQRADALVEATEKAPPGADAVTALPPELQALRPSGQISAIQVGDPDLNDLLRQSIGSDGQITPIVSLAPNNVATGTGFGDDGQTAFDGLSRGPQDPTGVLAAEDAAIAEQQAAQSDADAFAGLATVQDPTGVLAAEDAAIAAQQAAQSDADAFAGLATVRDPTGVLAAEDAAIAAQQAAEDDADAFRINRAVADPTGVLAAEDAAIAAQQAAQGDADAFGSLATVRDPTGVLAAEDAALAEEAAAQSDAEAFGPTTFGPTPPPPGTGFGDDQEEFTTDSLGNTFRNGQLYRAAEAEEDISQRDSFKVFANQQATLRARYQEPSSQDWRVRLVLAGSADYLYQDDNNTILKPLQDANGVIFPYTPQISTSYNAGYDETQLTHSNYRGYFYKGSHVGDINITATFTAQDTREAQYLLAVIHFFRSVTKMFYGQDAQRGTPPPLVYLIGLGEYQFNGHACLLSQFSYNLPADVDYIRATGFNNYGVNLLNRRAQASQSFPGSSLLGTTARLLASKLLGFPGAEPARPAPGPVTGGVNNTVRSTYVPTKMEIQLVLKPVQSRAQMSREFSLKNFANGNLLKGGYW